MRAFTITWRTTCAVCWLLASNLPVLATPSPQASQEVGHLLSSVEDSGCTFIRDNNGYPAAETRAHLQKRLDYLERGDLVADSEDFIERVATQSSLSGKPYQMHYVTQTRNSADQLSQGLRRLRQAP